MIKNKPALFSGRTREETGSEVGGEPGRVSQPASLACAGGATITNCRGERHSRALGSLLADIITHQTDIYIKYAAELSLIVNMNINNGEPTSYL